MTATYLVLAGMLVSTFLNVYALALISMIVSLVTLLASLCVGHLYPLGAAWHFACYLQVGYLSGLFLYGIWKSVSLA
jgi:hypothetical protein